MTPDPKNKAHEAHAAATGTVCFQADTSNASSQSLEPKLGSAFFFLGHWRFFEKALCCVADLFGSSQVTLYKGWQSTKSWHCLPASLACIYAP
jgi:hypothetical protein